MVPLFLFSLSFGIAAHAFVRRFWRATLLAAFLSTATFQMGACVVLGHVDKFVCIAVPITFAASFALGALCGLPFLLLRDQTVDRSTCSSCGYNLTGNTSGVCSECGQPIVDAGGRADDGWVADPPDDQTKAE